MDWPNKRPRLTSVVPPQLDNYQDFDIHTAQVQNDRRLKSKFEELFYKYERDFSGVGDEIDLETGEVIVDNGHLSGMRDEQDVGDVVHDTGMKGRTLLRALTVEPELRSAQISGRSLVRALTVAPEDLDTPSHNSDLDDQDVFSEEEGQFFAGDEWDDFGDEEEYNSEDDEDSFRGFDAGDELDGNSSDSDDSILGPKKDRRRSRDVYPISPPPSQAPANNHQLQYQRSQGFTPLREQPSLQVATDPTWRAPSLEDDLSIRAPRHDSIALSRFASYTSPNSKSLWAPIQAKRPRKNKISRSPPTAAKPAQERRQPLLERRRGTTSAMMHAASEESDDPLQSNLVTTPASTLKPSATRKIKTRVLPEVKTPGQELVSSGEVDELEQMKDPLVLDGIPSRPSVTEAQPSAAQDAVDANAENQKREGEHERHVRDIQPSLLRSRPMTEHERRSKAAKDSAAQRWETRRRNQELNRVKTDLLPQSPQVLSKQPEVDHWSSPQPRDSVLRKDVSEGGLMHAERVTNGAGNDSERPTRPIVHMARNGTCHAPYPPIVGNAGGSAAFREVETEPEQGISAGNMLQGTIKAAIATTESIALSHAAATTLERLQNAERYPGWNVIDFDDSSAQNLPQLELELDRDMGRSGDAANLPSLNPESTLHGTKRPLDRKLEGKQPGLGDRPGNFTSRKRKRQSNIPLPFVTKEQNAPLTYSKEGDSLQRSGSNSSSPHPSHIKTQGRYSRNSRPESAERPGRGGHEERIDMRRSSSVNSILSKPDASFVDDYDEGNYFDDETLPYTAPNLRRPASVTSFLGNGTHETTSVDTDGERPTTPLLKSVIEPFLGFLRPRGENKQAAAETSRENMSDDTGGDSDYQAEFSGSPPISEIALQSLSKSYSKSSGEENFSSVRKKSRRFSSKSRRTSRSVTSNSTNGRPTGGSVFIRVRDRTQGWRSLVGASSGPSRDSSTS